MYKSTNIESLGEEYTISNPDGVVIKKIRVIKHLDILDAALGPYDPEKFNSVALYLESSIALLEGFDKLDPNTVLWYTSEQEEIVLAEVIEYAVIHGYDKIILEYLEEVTDLVL